jgi:hypothetical protein
VGAATSVIALARSIGGAVGAALTTAVLFAAIGSAADLMTSEGNAQPDALAHGFSLVFLTMTAAMFLSPIAAAVMPARNPAAVRP